MTATPSQCVTATAASVDGGACVQKTCVDYLLENKDCSPIAEGCGGTMCTGTGIAVRVQRPGQRPRKGGSDVEARSERRLRGPDGTRDFDVILNALPAPWTTGDPTVLTLTRKRIDDAAPTSFDEILEIFPRSGAPVVVGGKDNRFRPGLISLSVLLLISALGNGMINFG